MISPLSYDDAYVQSLFDRMGRTYDVVNFISSFGFSTIWRKQCVKLAGIKANQRVCDMMAGGGECWRPVLSRGASLVSIDFSRVMVERQARLRNQLRQDIDVRCENATSTSLENRTVDAVVCAFGLKTLSADAIKALACEVMRILKPGGQYAFIEISTADRWLLGPVFRWYVSSLIPIIGRLCLGDIECYRMLGRYTEAFGSCSKVIGAFESAGLTPQFRSHFYGCATSLSGIKPV